MSTEPSVSVRHEPEAHRFVITSDGVLAGYAEYRDERTGEVRNFVHTVVDQAYSGQGLGGTLVSQALEQTRGDGKVIIPTCPFVAGWLKRHPNFVAEVEWPAG